MKRLFRHRSIQPAAEIVMVLGIVALCQPWVEVLHRYGLTVTIVGLLLFMFSGWFGPKGNVTEASRNAVDGVFDVSDRHDGQFGVQARAATGNDPGNEADGPVGVRA